MRTEDIELEDELNIEESIQIQGNKPKFKIVNHSERAEKFGRLSDGEMAKYVNVALEYFGNRCALSGEEFVKFDKKIEGKNSNLSAEHVVALCLGGDDILPNLVPTVLQYNLKKNGYYLLDYWQKQKDNDGKTLYSLYRLLKLVNFMMKSMQAREYFKQDEFKDYKKLIKKDNKIDEFIKEIEKIDEVERENNKRNILSSTITSTVEIEDNKQILTTIPSIEGNIPELINQSKEKSDEIEMMDIFINDAVNILNSELNQERINELKEQARKNNVQIDETKFNLNIIKDQLEQMQEDVIGEIPFEVKVRNIILQKIKSLGIEENKYSVANDLLNNTDLLSKSKNLENEEIIKLVSDTIDKQVENVKINFNEEEITKAISADPAVLYQNNLGLIIKVKSEITPEEQIKEQLLQLGIKKETLEEKDVRNLYVAKEVVEGYDFKESIGREINQEEKRAIIEVGLNLRILNKEKTSYLSTTINNLEKIGLSEQEIYGFIINTATKGNVIDSYSSLIKGRSINKIKEYIKENNGLKELTKVTEETINDAISKNKKKEKEDSLNFTKEQSDQIKEELRQLGIKEETLEKKDVRNLYIAKEIVEKYKFEENIGRAVNNQEKKIVIELLLGISLLNKDMSDKLSTTINNLEKLGLSEQEIYGFIINTAVKGNGIDAYSNLISGKAINKIKKYMKANKRLEEEKTKVTKETIKDAILKNKKKEKEESLNLAEEESNKIKKELREFGISEEIIEEKAVKNLYVAKEIVEKYNFKEIIGRDINEEEKRAVIEAVLNPRILNKGKCCYLSTTINDLEKIGLLEQEIYGFIINTAVKGNGIDAYSNLVKGNATKKIKEYVKANKGLEEEKTKVTEKTVKNAILKDKEKEESNKIKEKLKQLGIKKETLEKKDVRNLYMAREIVEKYNFEENIGRKVNNEEKKTVIEVLLGNSSLNKGKGCYLSTIINNLEKIGLLEQEIYGFIINTAVKGNGIDTYTNLIGGRAIKKIEEYIKVNNGLEELTKVTKETINDAISKNKKKEKEDSLNFTKEQSDQIKEELRQLGIKEETLEKKDVRNLYIAKEIVEKYKFEENIGRAVNNQEKKIVIELLLGNSSLNKGKGCYLSTTITNLERIGLLEQEIYGFIINTAVKSNVLSKYSTLVQGGQAIKRIEEYIKENSEVGDEKTKVTEETIQKALNKKDKKSQAKTLVKKAVVKAKENEQLDENIRTRQDIIDAIKYVKNDKEIA